MRARYGVIDRLRRRRTAWCVALVAALLNAFAPVFAYAIGQPLHELAGGPASGGAQRVLAAQAARHAAQHAGTFAHHAAHDAGPHAMHRAAPHGVAAAPPDGSNTDDPATPHCPYCL